MSSEGNSPGRRGEGNLMICYLIVELTPGVFLISTESRVSSGGMTQLIEG